MNTQQDTEKIFLEEFVKRLIINSFSKLSKIESGDNLLEKLDKTTLVHPIIAIRREEKPIRKVEENKIQKAAIIKIINPLPVISEKSMTLQQTIPKSSEEKNVPIMERLNPILADPSVQSINCPGPNKNLLITRRGIIQTVQLSFSKNEIDTFTKDISEKTKIPLTPGLFKVLFQNLIITAIISEFIGTKFLVEKRAPQTFPQIPTKVQFK